MKLATQVKLAILTKKQISVWIVFLEKPKEVEFPPEPRHEEPSEDPMQWELKFQKMIESESLAKNCSGLRLTKSVCI